MELINLPQTCVSYTQEQLHYQKEIHEGIYDALGLRLSPKLIEPQTMQNALTDIPTRQNLQFKRTRPPQSRKSVEMQT